MKLRPPKRVKIGPHRYDVTVQDDRIVSADGQGFSCGQVDYQQGTIRLLDGAPHYVFETFIHECVHAMSYATNIDLSEDQTQALGNVLAAFLIDNGYVKEPS